MDYWMIQDTLAWWKRVKGVWVPLSSFLWCVSWALVQPTRRTSTFQHQFHGRFNAKQTALASPNTSVPSVIIFASGPSLASRQPSVMLTHQTVGRDGGRTFPHRHLFHHRDSFWCPRPKSECVVCFLFFLLFGMRLWRGNCPKAISTQWLSGKKVYIHIYRKRDTYIHTYCTCSSGKKVLDTPQNFTQSQLLPYVSNICQMLFEFQKVLLLFYCY